MPSPSKIIENRHTGERIEITASTEETGGEYLGFEFYAKPNGGVPFEHYHAKQREYFRMVAGELTVVVDGDATTLRPGDELTLEPGTKHSIVNGGSTEAHCYVEYRPALKSEWWFTLIHPFEHAEDREATLLEVAPFLSQGVEVYPANLPRWLGRPVIYCAGLIGRLLGTHKQILRARDAYFADPQA
jgi:quercetin dioxygenase-like cupin family protein